MKVLVTGSREFTDAAFMHDTLDYLLNHSTVILIHGKNRSGADAHAATWCAKHRGVYEIPVPAKWTLMGKYAGNARNRVMGELMPDRVIAFYKTGARNRGTSDMVRVARDLGIRQIDEHWR